ncbi:hypothetical protein [Yoonia litorea]|uniref:Uncharacterized protein n=1 Tax=Yoonia litorea TaxID=1123755 RepID=A0A1I6MGH6_9RHOB|nr:hypothetical protein [Yoonia litorea]SFS14701.1 hypothetical protein SAMN05444714_1739 [Yoonia litorea]
MSAFVKLSVRSVSRLTQQRLRALKDYSRLPYGALLDDGVEALWEAYQSDGHELPEPSVETT